MSHENGLVNGKAHGTNAFNEAPTTRIFLRPIAPPAALGLAGFAGSTFITSSYIANWWGSPDSPTIFFPFVGVFGGLAQFLAGLRGFDARDGEFVEEETKVNDPVLLRMFLSALVSVINTMWGSFWISIGILYAFVVRLPPGNRLLRGISDGLNRQPVPSSPTQSTRTSQN